MNGKRQAMHRVLLLGSGKIGRMIATLLTGTGDYQVKVGDVDTESLVRLAR
jgi:saccharopine dehydrogenase-like NADP-dependent oxidoreductase